MNAPPTPPPTAPGSSSPAAVRLPLELPPGTSLGGYVVLERIGAGGMGVVYSAWDSKLERRVAVKLVRPERSGDEAMLREARALGRVAHPNVVTVHVADRYLDDVFIAMEFMGGGTLRSWVATKRPWREVLARYLEAGEGLAAAHAAGLLHRDFKPDNVLLDEAGHAHVTDFGLARETREVAARPAGPRRPVGTPGYMSPEQRQGDVAVDERTDQFSFCAALYEGLTGELPFGREPPSPLPVPALPGVPRFVRRALQRGLSERPTDRFASMGELLAALRADPARRWLAAGAVALGLAALTPVAALALRESPEQRAQAECRARAQSVEAGIFGAAQQGKISSAFAAAAPGHGAEDFERIRTRLGPEAQGWLDLSREACAMRDAAAKKQLETCLEERRKTLQSISTLFASADAKVVENALTTVLSEVSPSAGCRGGRPPVDETLAAGRNDEALREELAKARVFRAAGKYDDAEEKALEVAGDARDQESREVEAEADLLVGELLGERRKPDADDYLRKSALLADGVANDELRAQAWLSLASLYAMRSNYDRPLVVKAEDALRSAEPIVARLGSHLLLRAAFLVRKGEINQVKGFLEQAQENFRQALEVMQALLRPDDPRLLAVRTELALVLPPEEGRPMQLEVLHASEKLFGPEHPETATAWHNLGTLELNDMATPEALAVSCPRAKEAFARAIAIRERTRKTDAARLGRSYGALGDMQGKCGAGEEAVQSYREDIALLVKGGAPDEEVKHELVKLEHLLQNLGRNPEACEVIEEITHMLGHPPDAMDDVHDEPCRDLDGGAAP